MNYLPFTLLAYLCNGLAVTIDKFLLVKSIPQPLTYVFYISLVSLPTLLLMPWTKLPTQSVLSLASLSTLLWTGAAYFMFRALRSGQVPRVIPAIGALTPLLLLIFAASGKGITINEGWAAAILILGLILITSENLIGKIKREELFLICLSSLLFASSYLSLKAAYGGADFLTVLVYSRLVLIPLIILSLIIPTLKRQVLPKGQPTINVWSKTGLLFGMGQLFGGTGQLLLTFSISLASPAIINSLQGTQYVFLLGVNLLLSKKFPHIFKIDKSPISIGAKIIGLVLIMLGLYILAFAQKPAQIKLGVTFSPRYAQQLHLNPQTTYLKILDELKVKRVRIPIYWDEVEQFPRQFDFSQIDFYLEEALLRDVEVILVLGYKQPRWPECFAPPWIEKMMRKDQQDRQLRLIEEEVKHFKKYPNIRLWQIENEPLFNYGLCPKVDAATKALLEREVKLVKSLDQRPIMMTDSGELGGWIDPQRLSDVFGTTLYRHVWNPYFGVVEYPLPPIFYFVKNQTIRIFTNDGETIISELQAEPWIKGSYPISSQNIDEQFKTLPVSKLKSYLEYAHLSGFSEIYIWGVEWWYFMAQNGHPEYLEYGRTLFIE